jgi:DNA-binding MarR family transcriptional regulator
MRANARNVLVLSDARSAAPVAARAAVPSLVDRAQVTSLINLAARLTGKAARIRMGPIGAWPGQIPLLLWLLEQDGVIQKHLVERSNMEQSTVAEHLERMERDGLVTRERSRDDKRKYRFYLTPKAKRASDDLVRMLESGAQTFTKGIAKDELALFMRVLRRIIANLDDYVRDAGKGRRAARALPPRRLAPKRTQQA